VVAFGYHNIATELQRVRKAGFDRCGPSAIGFA
jgi:hypothetical protein